MTVVVTKTKTTKTTTTIVATITTKVTITSVMTEHGHRVIFDDDDAYIEDKTTGEQHWMFMDGGMYAVRMWVKTGV